MTDSTAAPKKQRAPRKTAAAVPVIDAVEIDTPEVELTSPVSKGELAPVVTPYETTHIGSRLAETFDVDPAEARKLAATINVKDTNSIITFGTASQKNISAITDQMLTGVKNKDLGPVGTEMVNMVTSLKSMNFKSLAPSKMPGFVQKLMGMGKAVERFKMQYDTVESSIAKSEANLQNHRITLLRDIAMLDTLYNKTGEHLDNLELYIVAGEMVLQTLDTEEIPAAQLKSKTTNDMQDAQLLRDLIEARDALERKVHDLKLSRQITIQALPSIRTVQANDRGMAEKLQSQVLNTIPLWKQQMVVALSIHHSREAANASKVTSDYTNKLLVSTSEALRLGNVETRKEMERGIVDIGAIQKANENLIGTINDSLRIAEEGRSLRAQAEVALVEAEGALKGALTTARDTQLKLDHAR